jgi:hypothetical protein
MPGSARLVVDVLGPPAIARARQHGFQLILDQLFNEPADPSTHRALNRVKPVVEK